MSLPSLLQSLLRVLRQLAEPVEHKLDGCLSVRRGLVCVSQVGLPWLDGERRDQTRTNGVDPSSARTTQAIPAGSFERAPPGWKLELAILERMP